MKQQTITSSALFILAIATVYGSHYKPAQTFEDPIVASFERELNHEPGEAAPATRSSIDDDVLYDLISTPLQSDSDVPEARND